MENVSSYEVGQLETGAWVALSLTSPYFCLEGSTEAEVLELAQKALTFYGLEKSRWEPARADNRKSLSTYYPKRAMTFDKCVPA